MTDGFEAGRAAERGDVLAMMKGHARAIAARMLRPGIDRDALQERMLVLAVITAAIEEELHVLDDAARLLDQAIAATSTRLADEAA